MMFETSKHVPKTEKRCVFKDNSQIDNNASKNGSTRSLSTILQACSYAV